MSKASSTVPSETPKDGDRANLSRTFKYLLATQFLSRGIPFIFNSWIVRHLTQEDYAVYAVQFHLFVTCVLFLSREGFRRACMRADIKLWFLSPLSLISLYVLSFICFVIAVGSNLGLMALHDVIYEVISCLFTPRIHVFNYSEGASAKDNAALLKVAWMSFPLGVVITIAGCVFVFWWQGLQHSDPYAQAILINGSMELALSLRMLALSVYSSAATSSDFKNVNLIASFACILELLAEPLYILSQTLLLLKLRLVVETLATFSRCVTMYILIVNLTNMEKGIVFALSQAAYGACIFLGYWSYFLLFRAYRSSDLIPFRAVVITALSEYHENPIHVLDFNPLLALPFNYFLQIIHK
ncbi:protein RFT1-like protein isoform X1 [Gossypium australe]|uniref:Protein RFT1 homolog n=1 Tax=Gossypium australe TaxID=47621 RepID=A0A5B6UU05_9ROSI|nr:protein RFT1-like protein isoform X1 [Gossypium australe]